MKTPSLIFIIALLLSFSCNAQLNELTVEELESITFIDITLGDIMGIQGQDSKATELFGEGNFESAINESCPFLCKYFRVNSNSFSFGFEDVSETGQEYYFTYLKVKKSSIVVTVKDVSIALGDDISIFEEKGYVISEKNNWVVFVDEETATIAIRFLFDPTTRKVEEIRMNTY